MINSSLRGLMIAAVLVASSITHANPLVFGTWASLQKVEDVSYRLVLAIQEKQSALSVTCSKAGKTTTARITVPSQVTAQKILIKGAAADDKTRGDLECTIAIEPMAFDYQLVGPNQMKLSAQGQVVEFERVESSFEN